jgi:hypothetical protein
MASNSRVLHLVHGVAEPWDESLLGARRAYGFERDRVPVGVVAVLLHKGVQKPCTVLGHAQKARAAAEQARRHGALQRFRGAEIGEPCGDRGRRETVVRQRDQHRLEYPRLAWGRPPPGHQPVRQLAEAHLAHQVRG